MPNRMINRVDGLFRGLGLFVCTMLIAACGGGDGDGDGIHDGVLAAAFEGEEDQLGIFQPWERLRNRCETPRRAGERGASEADQPGTAVDEKNFLRSYMNDTYLWYDEVEYPDPADDAYSVQEYFEALIARQNTPSGRPRDMFSGSIPIEDPLGGVVEGGGVEGSVVGGGVIGYGFEAYFAIIGGEIVVFDVEPSSPADQNGLSRGAHIVSIGGRTLVPEIPVLGIVPGIAPGIDIFAFLYPQGDNPNQDVAFEVRDPGSTATRTVTMRPAQFVLDPVRYTRVIETDTGDVGYLFFNSHSPPSEKQLIEAFGELAEADVTDLVLDLRYNTGGLGEVAAEVASMIASPSAASGKVFLFPRFNDKHPTHDPVSGDPIEPLYFRRLAYGFSAEPDAPLPNLNLNRVFILSTGLTCSASEAVINGLRGIDIEVILIGATTCGKPYGIGGINNCGTFYSVIQDQATNDKGFGAYEIGFSPQNATGPKGILVPGCEVGDDPYHALGDVDEAMLAAALQYRADGSCPALDRPAVELVALGGVPRRIGMELTR